MANVVPPKCALCREPARWERYPLARGFHVRARCQRCGGYPLGAGRWVSRALFSPSDLEVMPEADVERRRCSHCGALAVTELHHYAPQAAFDDADSWPAMDLCGACHSRWHEAMR